ncbi:hypothetical protein B4U80_14676, partial [Leptotrombidium deliense]
LSMASIGIDFGHSKLIAAVIKHEDALNGQPNIYTRKYVDVFENYVKYFEPLRNDSLRNKIYNLKQNVGNLGEDIKCDAQIKKVNSAKGSHQFYENQKDITNDEDMNQYKWQFNYTQLLALILRSLLKEVEKELEVEAINAVISVPALFTHFQRSAVLKAAKYAGFTDSKLINDTSAVALHYY